MCAEYLYHQWNNKILFWHSRHRGELKIEKNICSTDRGGIIGTTREARENRVKKPVECNYEYTEGIYYFSERYCTTGKKAGFIFTIRRARKASRKDAITGRSATLSFRRILGALDARFFIHYFTRDSAPHWYVISILSRPGISSFTICFLRHAYVRLTQRSHGKMKRVRPLCLSTISSFWTRTVWWR